MIFPPSPPPTARRRPPTPTRGFTLLEMMVSLALVLVLMLAVTRIFTIASQTVGASQALSASTRDAKAAQTVFTRDLGALAPDAGAFTLYSGVTQAFRNPIDLQGDRDGNVNTIDANDNGSEADGGTDNVSFTGLSSRNHRVDTLGFFARDRFGRQTGKAGDFITRFSASEAYINYGHARQPDNSGTLASALYPGAGTAANNPNNFFAAQWVLARSTVLLADATSIAAAPIAQGPYYVRNAAMLSPLNFTGVTTSSDNSVGTDSSRFDLGGTSIATFKSDTQIYSDPSKTTFNPNWFRPLIFNATNATARPARFFVKPFVSRPYDSANLAYNSPAFVTGCSQFVVEFAGDYLTQNAAGAIALPPPGVVQPDGEIDFVIVSSVKQIRWYGFPRKTSAVGTVINPGNGDVAPVSASRSTGAANYAPFERSVSTDGSLPPGALAGGNALTDWSLRANTPANSYYAVVWGPADMASRPKMLRITLVIDRAEAQGRLEGGQTFEYVFSLP